VSVLAPSHSKQLIAWLDRQQGDRSLVGGKGLSLSQLAFLGAPVPPAFALTTAAYDLIANVLELPVVASANDTGKLAIVQERLFRVPLPPALSTALFDASATLRQRCGDVSLAVRSSAPAEDSVEASFAGVHDTFLDIHSLSDLESAVRRCWASLWSERAVTYRLLRGVDAQPPTIAVVVQQMIQSDVSFVVFTSDPVTARADHLVISASWGLGEAIVSGQVNPDHIVVGPAGEIVEYVIGKKQIMIVPGASPTDGPRDVPVPRALQDVPALTTSQVGEIAQLARHVAGKLGYEADLEGAISEDRLYLFQARPITTISSHDAAPAITARTQS
jgi:pyruvate,water dikinase